MNYMTTKSYRPANLINDMDRMFNQLYSSKAPAHRGFNVDIAETPEVYRIEADLPGFAAEDVDVRVEENLVVIEARVLENDKKGEENKEEEKVNWYVRERKQGNLKRSFVLPEDVNKNGVEAAMKNGILTVDLKKKPEAKPFTVKVKGQ
jgi:HSP20 family protein